MAATRRTLPGGGFLFNPMCPSFPRKLSPGRSSRPVFQRHSLPTGKPCALHDSRTADHLVVRKFEYDLLQRMPVLRKVDVARVPSSKRTDDLVVINPLTRMVDRWHVAHFLSLHRNHLIEKAI